MCFEKTLIKINEFINSNLLDKILMLKKHILA